MKSKEELSALKSEVEALNKKLSELSEEELSEVTGGDWYDFRNVRPLNESLTNGNIQAQPFIGMGNILDDKRPG